MLTHMYCYVFFSVDKVVHPVFQVDHHQLVKGLCAAVKLDVYFPGFPTLKHIPHSARLERRGVRVFQAASRDENVILTITRDDTTTMTVCLGSGAHFQGSVY